MKKLRKKLSRVIGLVLAMAMMLSVGTGVMAEDGKAYVYPVQPGTPEWAAFTTMQQKIDACQIPDNVLNTATTDELIDIILDYPMLSNIFAFDSVAQGFDSISEYFNGLQELATRDDAAGKLMNKFERTPIGSSARSAVDFDSVVEVTLLETMLSDSDYYSKLDSSEQEEFQTAVDEKLNAKLENKELYGLSLSPYYEQNSDIAPLYDNFVLTPNGTKVDIEVRSDISQETIRYLDQKYDSAYPAARRISSASGKYNCHSYAWYYSSSTNNYWMPDASAYWQDGSYSQTYDSTVGCKALYGGGIHSGVVTDTTGIDTIITSKWANAGLYIHSANDSPYIYGNSVTYYER